MTEAVPHVVALDDSKQFDHLRGIRMSITPSSLKLVLLFQTNHGSQNFRLRYQLIGARAHRTVPTSSQPTPPAVIPRSGFWGCPHRFLSNEATVTDDRHSIHVLSVLLSRLHIAFPYVNRIPQFSAIRNHVKPDGNKETVSFFSSVHRTTRFYDWDCFLRPLDSSYHAAANKRL